MQRKNNILNNSKRGGFAMIMAIAAIVVIAGIMALALSLTTQTAKRTTNLYLYEQIILYSQSAAEFTLLNIAQQQACVEPANNLLNYTLDNMYDINITLAYVYTDPSPCGAFGSDYTTVTTKEQNGSVLMDITVTVDNPNISSEPIRYFRRSMQKL
ncbi:MAG: hypothetical protein COB17_05460 [Sulfurimonas sp.]|nr:MAG: hypothetical protein COB17_05460 [Sulfurimonas sp.]